MNPLQHAQTYYQQGNWSMAEDAVRQLLQQAPQHPKGLELLALIALECGHPAEANALFQQALNAAPDDALIWCNFGHAQLRQILFAEALFAFQQACNLQPSLAVAHNFRGMTLQELNRPQESIEAFETALSLQPAAEIQYNLAVAYRRQERFTEALQATASVLRDHPHHTDALNNRGLIRQELSQFAKAREDFAQALSIDPHHGEAHFNQGGLGILMGDLPNAWQDYEWRWCKEGRFPEDYQGKPIWKGEPLKASDHLYIHADAGFGDSLQFVRYLFDNPAFSECTLSLGCQKALLPLFQAQNWPFSILDQNEPLPESITHTVPLLSLPYHHGTHRHNIPCPKAYIKGPEPLNIEWPKGLQDKRLKIGITWSGSPDNSINNKRSCDYSYFAKLIQHFPDLAWVSLQKETQPLESQDTPLPDNVWQVGDQLNSFADTARWVEQLDLIISVDTSLVHLASAMGKPTWVLLSAVPDWRWFLNSTETPWYANTRLFRQTQRGNWKDVFWQIKKALKTPQGAED